MNNDILELKQFFGDFPAVGSITFGPSPFRSDPFRSDPFGPTSVQPAITEEQEEQLKEAKEATKFDSGKTDWSLMPFDAVEQINKVLEFGAKKYNDSGKRGKESWNWAKGSGLGKMRVLNAVFRHLFAYARGEKLDPESGLSHLSHAGCGILFMIYYTLHPQQYTKD
jgi:hypothetical protein